MAVSKHLISKAASTRISIQSLIACAIIFSMLLLGGVLSWKNYSSVQQIMVSAAGESAAQLGRTLNERARRLIDPPQNVIRLLAYDPVTQAHTLAERLDRLPILRESLNANEMLSAILVGYKNGEFILLRELSNPDARQSVAAPDEAQFLVQVISLIDGELLGEWRYYDRNLVLLQAEAKPDYHFDPRTRPWFKRAIGQADTVMTRPYGFYTTHQAGVTLAQRSAHGDAVIGMDVALSDLSVSIKDLRVTPNTKIAVVNRVGTVISSPDTPQLATERADGGLKLPTIAELGVPSLKQLFKLSPERNVPLLYQANGQSWYGMRAHLSSFTALGAELLIAVPKAEMLTAARRALAEELRWVAVITIVLLILGWLLGHQIGKHMRVLSNRVQALSAFDFRKQANTRPSRISEIHELGQVLDRMSSTIHSFQDISLTLSHETHLDGMLCKVLEQLVIATAVEGGAVYLASDDGGGTLRLAARHGDTYPRILALDAHDSQKLADHVTQALGGDQYLAVALDDRNGKLLGVLVLNRPDTVSAADGSTPQAFQRFVEEISGTAAIAIETRQLIEAQQRLIDAIIELLANAIDAKSPYTGGHCARVPHIAELLLDHAIEADSGPYAGFTMDEAGRYEFRIAAWLHDCGKITSPESIIDKATKLEAQYNRIHEIRTRFEVLWRDAEIQFLKDVAQGDNPETLQATLERHRQALRDEFAFLANANIGGEQMSDADLARVARIGARRWWRHFDNRIGLAGHEIARFNGIPAQALPVEERLLADLPEHIVPWDGLPPPVAPDDPRNVWGFNMKIPDNAYNYGELYNLSIRRGTLTSEERFKINEHIVQTIMMLNSLPLPEHLKKVPTIAGNHHEKMDGTGYPRRVHG
ncbi:MAG: phosphohydrolase, partial [Alcaligenaceae bacterium]|nr:phosphohydrolase [Alcaligenaceae bacterium]